jgi:hypothetical protein
MQTAQTIHACKAIYTNPTLNPATKLDVIASLLGLGGTTSTTALAVPRRRGRPPTTTKAVTFILKRRTRGPAASSATAKAKPSLNEQVYAKIPNTGGIVQTSIKLRGVRPNIIGTALSRLRKKGLLVEQNGVWFQVAAQQKAA